MLTMITTGNEGMKAARVVGFRPDWSPGSQTTTKGVTHDALRSPDQAMLAEGLRPDEEHTP